MKKKLLSLAVAFLLFCSLPIAVFASEGPATGSSTASVTNTAGTGSTYSFGYAFDSTYYGSLSSDRPNVSTDGDASVAFSSNTFTITAKSAAGYNPSLAYWDTSAQNVSTEVTITNNSSSTLKIGYTYSVSNGTTSGSDLAVGSGTLTWLPGESIFLMAKTQVTAWTAASSTATATFTITSCKEVVSYDLSIYPSQFGSYTYSIGDDVAGTLASDSAAYTTEASASDTVTLSVPTVSAAYADEYYFYGWSVNGVVTASSAAYTSAVTTNTTVFPVFIKNGTVDESGNGPFYVNGKYYVFWREAFVAAGTSYPVVVARDYTLPATLQENGLAEPDGKYVNGSGSNAAYIVPVGSTLLIPYDSANTLITSDMGDHVNENYSSPPAKTLYRQLTMPSGTSITVNGAISVGSQALNLMLGQVGPYGCIVMDEGSNITVKSGGNLYAYGYIFYGEGAGGTVTVESGANVYESAFAMDYPGNVSNTKELTDAAVFPLRNVTFRNVEVPMTLYSGATEKVFYCVYGTVLGGNLPGYISLIGNTTSNAFCLNTGATMTKSYSDGMQYFTVNGNVSVNSLDISMTYLVFDYDANTSETSGFPIASNYDVTIASGTLTLNDNLICYEGSKFTIVENATVSIGSKNIYILDADDDPGAMQEAGTSTIFGSTNVLLLDVHGTQYGRRDTDAVWVINGTVSIGSGGFYTSTGKAEIISTGKGKVVFSSSSITSDTVDIRYGRGYISEGDVGYKAVEVTSAYLLNSDGSYTNTSAGSTTATYTYTDGFWRCGTHTWDEGVVTAPTCTDKGYTTHTCTVCGYSYTDTETSAKGHTWDWDTHKCSVCGEAAIEFAGIQLSIESEIQLRLKFDVHSDLLTYAPNLTAYVTEEENAIEAADSWSTKVADLETDSNGRYVITQGIAAGEMTGIVAVQFKNGDTIVLVKSGSETVETVEKTVVSFAEAALAKEGENGKNVALSKAALTFGGYAQTFYGTHTDELAYKLFFTDTDPDVTVDSWDGYATTVTSTDGFSLTPTTQKINLDSKIDIRVYFTGSASGYTAEVTRPTNMGKETETVDIEFVQEGERYYLDIKDVPPAYWNDTYTITVKDSTDNTKSYTVSTSVLAWCAKCVNAQTSDAQKNMARAMYHYAKAADTYFGIT